MSQNVPVDDTKAWRTGLRVCAAAATIGAEPSPDSFEKSPRAIPYLAAIITVVPAVPPTIDLVVNAQLHINFIAGHT